MADAWVPVYLSDLEALRALFAIGMIAVLVLAALVWNIDRPATVKRNTWDPNAYCPLHRGDMADCHDKHGTPDA